MEAARDSAKEGTFTTGRSRRYAARGIASTKRMMSQTMLICPRLRPRATHRPPKGNRASKYARLRVRARMPAQAAGSRHASPQTQRRQQTCCIVAEARACM